MSIDIFYSFTFLLIVKKSFLAGKRERKILLSSTARTIIITVSLTVI